MKRKSAIKGALIGLLTLVSAILAMYKFMYGYMTAETINTDGTAHGSMRNPEIMDMLFFLGIVLFGFIGLIAFVFNILRFFNK